MRSRSLSHSLPRSRTILLVCIALLLLSVPRTLPGQPPGAASAFQAYAQQVESRLARQHQSGDTFLVLAGPDPVNEATRLRNGEPVIEQINPARAEFAGSLLHHWRGTAFVP